MGMASFAQNLVEIRRKARIGRGDRDNSHATTQHDDDHYGQQPDDWP
jgi:hypothetical protein